MIVNDVETMTRHMVTVDLADSSERMKPDYKQGEFRPATVHLRWLFRDGEWTLERCSVAGPMIKKDGTDSQNSGKADYHYRWSDNVKPSWLVDLIERYESTRPVTA